MTSLFPLLPVQLDLTGRAAVLLSGEAELAPIARRLLDCGAGVTVFDKSPASVVSDLSPPVRLIARRWRISDLAGVALVVAGAAETRLARARAASKSARALFFTPNEPSVSDISLAAAVAGGALAIGVTGPGLPPEIGQAVATRFEQSALSGIGGFLAAAARAADKVESRIGDLAERTAFWRAATEAALAVGAASPADWDAWIDRRLSSG